jgi:hypothetical protein
LISTQNEGKVIHSNFQEPHRLTGSNRVSADGTLWMNLWKLWIARHCCHRLAVCGDREDVSVKRTDEVEAARSVITDDGGVGVI